MDVKQESFDPYTGILKIEPDLVSDQMDGNDWCPTKEKTFKNKQDCVLGDTDNICEYQATREFPNFNGIKQECELTKIEGSDFLENIEHKSVLDNVNNFSNTIKKEPEDVNEVKAPDIGDIKSVISEYVQFKDESELLTSHCDLPTLKSEVEITDYPNYFAQPCSSKQTLIKTKSSKHTVRNVPKQKKSGPGSVLQKKTYSQAHTGTNELKIEDAPKTPNVETLQKVLEIAGNRASENCTDEDSPRDLRKETKVSKKRRKSNTDDKYSSDSEESHKHEPAKKKNKSEKFVNFSSSEEDSLNENNSIYSQNTTLAFSLSNKRTLAEGLSDTIKEVQVATPSLKQFNKFTKQEIGSSSPPHSSKSPQSPNISLRNSCSTSTGRIIDLTANNQSLTQWQQTVTEDLTRIKLVQEQQSTLLTQIWQTLQVKNVQALQCPPDVPEFPIERKRDFATFEDWLENPQNFNYMRTRLASIGGATIRNAVMNMLKFVISNRVGMAFNWAGSAPKSPGQPKKYSFKETLTYKALNEAAKISFQGRNLVQGTAMVGDLTDKTIGQACQDWLKLSKQRYKNNKT